MSLDNELVALFLTALEESPYFKNIELLETQAKEKDGFRLNAFEVSGVMTSPGQENRPAAAAPAEPLGPRGKGKARRGRAAQVGGSSAVAAR
jgi:hypothetical protein